MTDDFMQKCKDELYGILLKLQTKEDCAALLEDLCTYKEVEQMALRAHAAKLFMEGWKYSQIIQETELSSATISRVSRCVNHGSGGYRAFVTPDADPKAAAPQAAVPADKEDMMETDTRNESGSENK